MRTNHVQVPIHIDIDQGRFTIDGAEADASLESLSRSIEDEQNVVGLRPNQFKVPIAVKVNKEGRRISVKWNGDCLWKWTLGP
jgi:hypothetical protein